MERTSTTAHGPGKSAQIVSLEIQWPGDAESGSGLCLCPETRRLRSASRHLKTARDPTVRCRSWGARNGPGQPESGPQRERSPLVAVGRSEVRPRPRVTGSLGCLGVVPAGPRFVASCAANSRVHGSDGDAIFRRTIGAGRPEGVVPTVAFTLVVEKKVVSPRYRHTSLRGVRAGAAPRTPSKDAQSPRAPL